MTYIPAAMRRLVIERAAERCEYCLLPDTVTYYPHHIDHIVAEKHGGETVESNLCYCCAQCNVHKGSDLTSIDPLTGTLVSLFNPRHDQWAEHFRLVDARIEGTSPQGRATIRLFHFNDDEQIHQRQSLIRLGHYPNPH